MGQIEWALSVSVMMQQMQQSAFWAAHGGSLLACAVLDLLFTSCSE
jgi:hypothetical protein